MSNRFVCILAAGLVVTGCSTPTSSRYESAEVGRQIETSKGTIVSGRVVDVAGETTAAGPIAGGVIGGAGTGLATHNAWAAILGAVFGAGLGYATQQLANDREGIEYVVEMEDGRTVTLVQNRGDNEVPLLAGTAVLVQVSGTYSRVIPRPMPLDRPDAGAAGASVPAGSPAGSASAPAPTGKSAAAAGGWVDPDKSGTTTTTTPAAVPPPPPGGLGTAGPPPSQLPTTNQLAPSHQTAPTQATSATSATATTTQSPPASSTASSWAVPPTATQ